MELIRGNYIGSLQNWSTLQICLWGRLLPDWVEELRYGHLKAMC